MNGTEQKLQKKAHTNRLNWFLIKVQKQFIGGILTNDAGVIEPYNLYKKLTKNGWGI